MEFNEKIQQLRRSKGLTQEELAEQLFVSRTAISKWESGRGYPNIESLRAIAKFFSVSIDDLLSGEEVLDIAEEDSKHKEINYRDTVFALLDISSIILLFMPFFTQKLNGSVQAVSLVKLSEISLYIKASFYTATLSSIIWGVLMLVLQNLKRSLLINFKFKISIVLSSIGILLYILTMQPYAAVFIFVFLLIKIFILTNKR